MSNIEELQKEEQIILEVEEVPLEDLILLGDDKLINISITYPYEDKEGMIHQVKTKAKIKQLTLKELRNIDFENINMNTMVNILNKSLYQQDETLFGKELILSLPVGVSAAITRKILEISGVDTDKMGF